LQDLGETHQYRPPTISFTFVLPAYFGT
jgi:hypothetical protein